MNDKSSENYLDQLLESINDPAEEDIPFEEEGAELSDDIFNEDFEGDLSDLYGEEEPEDEDRFLQSFEQELNIAPQESSTSEIENSFNVELDQDADAPLDLSAILSQNEGDANAPKEKESLAKETNAQEATEINEQVKEEEHLPSLTGMDLAGDFDNIDLGMPASVPEEQTLKLTEDGEIDLSNMEDADLLSMLGDSAELSDIGALLNAGENGMPLEGDAFEEYANSQLEQSEQAASGAKVQEEPKGIKGLFAKLGRALFGKDDDEEEEETGKKDKKGKKGKKDKDDSKEESIEDIAAAAGAGDVVELSAENQQILEELEGEEEGGKGKKGKKGKKEKKPKEKKNPKPKKPKVEKVPDNTPPIPKLPAFLAFVVIISMTVLVLLGTNLVNYSATIGYAKAAYYKQNYAGAYEKLAGVSIKKADQELYNRSKTLAVVDNKYKSYQAFYSSGRKKEALDALVCAAGRYEMNQEAAIACDCLEELNTLGDEIETALGESFGMSMEDALSIYHASSRSEYTALLSQRMKELGIE